MASEPKINHQKNDYDSFSDLNKKTVSENTEIASSNGLTQDQLECLERDIAQVKLLYNIHDSSTPFFKNLLIEGLRQPIDFNIPLNKKPEWLDIETFNQGRKFALDNIAGISLAEMISNILLFSIKSALSVLIFTGATDSPFKCLLRYTSTFRRLKSWYDEDIWSDETNNAKKNLSVVRSMHRNVYFAMSTHPEKELNKKILLGNDKVVSFRLHNLLKEDAESFSAFSLEIDVEKIPKIWVSQTSMTFVQWAFVGLAVTYPENFGIHHASESDLQAFIHMWKALGYMLGIKDDFNLCTGDLETVREKTKWIIDVVIKPSFKDVSPEWEYMSRCMIDGGRYFTKGVTFEGTVLYTFHVLNLKIPKVRKFVTWWQLSGFYFTRFVFEYLCRFPIIPKILNFFVIKGVEMVHEATPELLNRWKEKMFPYVMRKNTDNN